MCAKYWYAVMCDNDDNDWGTGSNNYDTALEMVQQYLPEGYIAIIDDGADPVCVREVRGNDLI